MPKIQQFSCINCQVRFSDHQIPVIKKAPKNHNFPILDFLSLIFIKAINILIGWNLLYKNFPLKFGLKRVRLAKKLCSLILIFLGNFFVGIDGFGKTLDDWSIFHEFWDTLILRQLTTNFRNFGENFQFIRFSQKWTSKLQTNGQKRKQNMFRNVAWYLRP
jgi:hypothetical protein